MTRYTLLLLQLNNRDIKTGRCRCRKRRKEGSCYGHSEINGTRLGVKFVETFWIGKNDTMSSRLTFADHESVCAGHALFCQSAHIGHACPYIHALCSIYGETCWKKDLLKQICGGRHDNSLCEMPTPFISTGRRNRLEISFARSVLWFALQIPWIG